MLATNITYKVKNKTILNNVSLEVKPGEFIAVIGPNGAGKSTLLKILCGELQKYSGEVTLNGEKINSIQPMELALKRAVLSQSISLILPFKVSEVVMMGRYPHFNSTPSPADHAIVKENLALTGMEKFSDRDYLTLSGGEKQRVHLSRVLAQLSDRKKENQNSSKLLFLDEPVNGLDLKYQQQVMKTADQWKGRNNKVIAVLHDLNLAAIYADKILLLNNGATEIFDIPEKVLTKEIIKKVYEVEVSIKKETKESKMSVTPVYSSEKENFISVIV